MAVGDTMQGMNGIEVLTRLRKIDPDARVVIATADIQRSTENLTFEAGAMGFVPKPLVADEVLRAIDTALERGSDATPQLPPE